MIPKSDAEAREEMFKELWNLEKLIPDCVGMATVMVHKEGGVKTYVCWSEGGKLPLLAGTVFLQKEVLASCTSEPSIGEHPHEE